MPTSRRLHRLGSVALLSCLVLAAAAAPASAAGKTRWVDDDGRAGAAGCNASAAAPKSIQKAIDASGVQDTVKACPGTYKGRLSITGARTGLQLVSVGSHQAILRAPDANGLFGSMITITGVDGVLVKGFAIRMLRFPDCDTLSGITASDAKEVTISGNDIRSLPPESSRSCVDYGIRAIAGTTGSISGNAVKDYLTDGIYLEDAGTNVLVKANTLRFVHVAFDVAGGDAIQVRDHAVGRVRGNTIESPATPATAAGIRLYQANVGSVVVGNHIEDATVGVSANQVDDLLIKGNTIQGGQVGIDLLNADDLDVDSNTVTDASIYGIFASELSTGNQIHDNKAVGNGEDCRDETTPPPPIDNDWTNNDGDISFPAGICENVPG